ncbi:MAG TPA: prepilin-type N-terminal cleavage/methylation domain-containing protein [Candidatus Babeliales bacterium]|nr:prepilin-type N-terminal cleavage/methylation domain-containing protein [Candidatus Babeliales bacterium]
MLVRYGFTLIEFSIVSVLLAIFIGITVLNVSFVRRFLVRAEIETLHARCGYLQQVAQVENKQQKLFFDVEHHCYNFDNQMVVLPSRIQFAVLPGTKGPPSCAQHIIESPITFNNHCITFSPHGIIQSGTVYLTDMTTNTMYALSCSVAQVSFLRKYRYDGSWHRIN